MEEKSELKEKVVAINRVAKVVKGGRTFRFSAVVVVGDENGHIGVGNGKAAEVPDAIKKAMQEAKKNLVEVPIVDTTVPPRSKTTVSIFFSNAFLAIIAPTSLAASLLACFVFISLSNVEQLTNVFPATSSMICTYKFALLLYTHSLGLSLVPDTFVLTLKCLLVLSIFLSVFLTIFILPFPTLCSGHRHSKFFQNFACQTQTILAT